MQTHRLADQTTSRSDFELRIRPFISATGAPGLSTLPWRSLEARRTCGTWFRPSHAGRERWQAKLESADFTLVAPQALSAATAGGLVCLGPRAAASDGTTRSSRRLKEGFLLWICLPARGTRPTAARIEVPAPVQGLLIFVMRSGLPTLLYNHTALEWARPYSEPLGTSRRLSSRTSTGQPRLEEGACLMSPFETTSEPRRRNRRWGASIVAYPLGSRSDSQPHPRLAGARPEAATGRRGGQAGDGGAPRVSSENLTSGGVGA